MKYGEKVQTTRKDWWTGKTVPTTYTYRYTEWHEYHTDNEGHGMWIGDKQMVGTCDFSVAGCATEKTAKAKVRNWAKKFEEWFN